jgi:hypothetical protein
MPKLANFGFQSQPARQRNRVRYVRTVGVDIATEERGVSCFDQTARCDVASLRACMIGTELCETFSNPASGRPARLLTQGIFETRTKETARALGAETEPRFKLSKNPAAKTDLNLGMRVNERRHPRFGQRNVDDSLCRRPLGSWRTVYHR